MPLFEAEMDRDELRCVKEQIEGEAVNIVASGFDKYWKCGGYGISDNGPVEYWPSNGWTSPYNLAIFKNFGAERMAKMHSFSHQAMTMYVIQKFFSKTCLYIFYDRRPKFFCTAIFISFESQEM